jgi:hypothetical protein
MNTLGLPVVTEQSLVFGTAIFVMLVALLVAFGWTYDKIQDKKRKKTGK